MALPAPLVASDFSSQKYAESLNELKYLGFPLFSRWIQKFIGSAASEEAIRQWYEKAQKLKASMSLKFSSEGQTPEAQPVSVALCCEICSQTVESKDFRGFYQCLLCKEVILACCLNSCANCTWNLPSSSDSSSSFSMSSPSSSSSASRVKSPSYNPCSPTLYAVDSEEEVKFCGHCLMLHEQRSEECRQLNHQSLSGGEETVSEGEDYEVAYKDYELDELAFEDEDESLPSSPSRKSLEAPSRQKRKLPEVNQNQATKVQKLGAEEF